MIGWYNRIMKEVAESGGSGGGGDGSYTKLGTAVDLASYGSENPYEVEEDGLVLVATTGNGGSAWLNLHSNGDLIKVAAVRATTNDSHIVPFRVYAGMTISCAVSSVSASVVYRPVE